MGVTTQTSKRLSVNLMQVTIGRKFEPMLCKVAARHSFATDHLNLSMPDASQLKHLITEIKIQYTADFPAVTLQADQFENMQAETRDGLAEAVDPLSVMMDEPSFTLIR